MSIVVPFLALLLAAAFVAYHRMRLVVWTIISVAALAICWFAGVNQTAIIVAAVIDMVELVVEIEFPTAVRVDRQGEGRATAAVGSRVGGQGGAV